MKKLLFVKGHHFLNLLTDNSVVLDLGANKGAFAKAIHSIQPCEVHSVEPSKEMFDELMKIDNIRKYNTAISSTSGKVRFVIRENSETSSLAAGKASGLQNEKIVEVESLTFNDFLVQNGINKIDLLKIDIEGAENDLFDSFSESIESRTDQITIEFHDFLNHLKKSDVCRIIKRLSERYYVVKFSPRSYKDILFISKNRISYADYWSLKFISRYKYFFELLLMKFGLVDSKY